MAQLGQTVEPITCPLCSSFSSKRQTTFETHLTTAHQTSSQTLWNELNSGPKLCACGCQQVTTWLGWRQGYGNLLRGHNGNIYALYDADKAEEISQKRREKLVGKESWSKGLTKETDERVAARAQATSVGRQAAFDAGTIVAWSKGLTKETDSRLQEFADNQRGRFASGELTPWAKGLNKENDQRIKDMAAKVSLAHSQAKLRQHLDDMKRLKVDDVKVRIEEGTTLRVINDSLNSYVDDKTSNIEVACSQCGVQWTSSLRRLQHGRCYACDPGGSRGQQDVANYVRELTSDITTNDRGQIEGLELDIFVPAVSLAIEYNGLYWHSIVHKSAIYHQNKTDLCRAKGITLLHVFEDEWRDKRSIVESMISHRLGLTPVMVGARKCSIVELNTAERRSFFTRNHIDGDTQASWALGLSHNGEIITALSIRTPLHKKHQGALEIARFCTKVGTNVPGALSRLTSSAQARAKELGCQRLLSYVDTRLGASNSWSSAGWHQTGESPPRFWWTDFNHRFNRFKYKADKSRGLTEAQVAQEAGVVRIYGCKNLTYEISY